MRKGENHLKYLPSFLACSQAVKYVSVSCLFVLQINGILVNNEYGYTSKNPDFELYLACILEGFQTC